MKKYILFFLIFSIQYIFTYDFLENDKFIYDDIESSYVIKNKKLFHSNWSDKLKEIKLDDIILDNSGFYIIKHTDYKKIMIPGESYFNFFNLDYFESEEYKKRYNESFPDINTEFNVNLNIDNIKATSYLIENIKGRKIEYKPEYLLNRFVGDCVCHPFNYNLYSSPWVDGVKGDGIGEKIEISFKELSNFIVILNGFVNPGNKNLFKENNRLKRIKIYSLEPKFDIEYNFDDFVYFADIIFPQKTKNITIQIIDVFKGSKFNDTCITAIFAVKKNVRRNIEEEIKKYGIIF